MGLILVAMVYGLLVFGAIKGPGDDGRSTVWHRKRFAKLSLFMLATAVVCLTLAAATAKSVSWIATMGSFFCAFTTLACPICLMVSLVFWVIQGLTGPVESELDVEPLGFNRSLD